MKAPCRRRHVVFRMARRRIARREKHPALRKQAARLSAYKFKGEKSMRAAERTAARLGMPATAITPALLRIFGPEEVPAPNPRRIPGPSTA